jgi:polar amino acid transport system permease protein
MDVILQTFFDSNPVRDYFPDIMEGFSETLQLSMIAGALSLIWGLILALLRQLPGKIFAPVRGLTIAYIDIFRGVPLLLVLLTLYTSLGVLAGEGTIPDFIGHPEWFGKTPNFWIGIYALVITYGAYMAEVYRAGLEAVPRGQMEAARSLGMSHGQAMRHVVVPQAVNKVTPPLLNDFIALMKDTALVSVIGLNEVVQTGSDVQAQTYKSSALVMAAILFLLVTIPLARILDRMIAGQQTKMQRAIP